eukprot:10300317-Alexandrium_andersonii.AAC.1
MRSYRTDPAQGSAPGVVRVVDEPIPEEDLELAWGTLANAREALDRVMTDRPDELAQMLPRARPRCARASSGRGWRRSRTRPET